MTDLFRDKAAEWDQRPVPAQISEGVFAAIQREVPLDASLTVMDFSAGTGLIAARIAPRVREVLAVDVSRSMLDELAKKPELAERATVYCQDILEVPLGRSVDLIVSAMAMHHVNDTAALARAFFAHTTRGGRVALADLDVEDGTFHPANTRGVFHHGFDREVLGRVMRDAGFDDVRVCTACEVDKENKRYSIFLLTARKPMA